MLPPKKKLLTPQLILYTLVCCAAALTPLALGWVTEWRRPAVWLLTVLAYRWIEQSGFTASPERGPRKGEWIFYGIYLGLSGSILLPAVEFAYIQRTFSMGLLLLGLAIAAFGTWVRYQMVTTLGAALSTHVEIRPGQKLVDHGICRYIRHPGYAGVLLFTIGAALILDARYSLGYIFLFFVPMIAMRIIVEERDNAENLAGYREYMQRSKKLIPYIF